MQEVFLVCARRECTGIQLSTYSVGVVVNAGGGVGYCANSRDGYVIGIRVNVLVGQNIVRWSPEVVGDFDR